MADQEPKPVESPDVPASESAEPMDDYSVRIEYSDLSANRPGKEAGKQARAEREAAPLKTLLGRVFGAHNDERAWRTGASGERRVGAALERLPPPWKVLHSVPVGKNGADIDHVAMGLGGVFTINTKHHPDAEVWVGGDVVMVNGKRYPYVRNSRFEADRTAKLLARAVGFEVPVRAAIALVGFKRLDVKTQPDSVHVTARRKLNKWLTGFPSTLSQGELDLIFAAARRSDTWR